MDNNTKRLVKGGKIDQYYKNLKNDINMKVGKGWKKKNGKKIKMGRIRRKREGEIDELRMWKERIKGKICWELKWRIWKWDENENGMMEERSEGID